MDENIAKATVAANVTGSEIEYDARVVWPAKPAILSALLAFCAVMFWTMTNDYAVQDDAGPGRYQYAMGAFFFFGGLTIAFALECYRWLWSLGFGLLWGVILAGAVYWSGGYDSGGFDWDWSFWAGIASLTIATPIFQTLRDNPHTKRVELPYDRLHFYSWSDAVIGASALAFTGLSWLLLLLISELFQLIGIDLLKELIASGHFGCGFSGAAFGAALGILRENDRILGLLQDVVLIVLSVLAPFLAAALGVFLISLMFTGMDNLWESTKSTTPILISCAVGAVVLANAIIRNNEVEGSRSKLLRIAAIILACTILPLAMMAAVSTGLRIDQHGLTPERLWGLLVVAIGVAYGLAYLVSVVRAMVAQKLFGWTGFVRAANIKLAIGLCLIALFLSLPLMDFGAISARDQLARLNEGDVSEEEFDYYALANDFGPTGRVLAKQIAAGKGERAKLAQEGLAAVNRWEYRREKEKKEERVQIILSDPARGLPESLRASIEKSSQCEGGVCRIIWDEDARIILLRKPCPSCAIRYSSYTKENEIWRKSSLIPSSRMDELNKDTEIEIRDVTKRQIFVNGKALGVGF